MLKHNVRELGTTRPAPGCGLFPGLAGPELEQAAKPFLLAVSTTGAGSSPEMALARAMNDWVMAALGACSISGTPLLRASIIVR